MRREAWAGSACTPATAVTPATTVLWRSLCALPRDRALRGDRLPRAGLVLGSAVPVLGGPEEAAGRCRFGTDRFLVSLGTALLITAR